MSLLLLHPPLDDPTLPYHSTAYLAGHLRANGFRDVALRDVNIEFLNDAFQEETIRGLQFEAERRLGSFKAQPHLTYQEQEAYYGLTSAPRIEADKIRRAVAALRCRDTFLDYSAYVASIRVLKEYLGFLGALSYPADQRDFSQATEGRFSVASLSDLTHADLGERICFPFGKFFDRALAGDAQFQRAGVFGISVVYDHQLFHALYLARKLKRQWPNRPVVLGGTAISQCYKYIREKERMKEFFDFCDAVVVGEGETAILEIAAAGADIQGRKFTNTIAYDRRADTVSFPQIKYENVSALGAPWYDHPWELYLSPERGINYSPTRGCYWNRCTFCDYGLNTDGPTSPWRERKAETVVSDLRQIAAEHEVKYVYFAVDVMAPKYLERLSDSLSAANLDLHWAAELRMEKVFSEERARKMARAGCVCVSFGMESGSQRVLDLMDKGTRTEYMADTMRNFSRAGIACQLMAFTDFPTETPQERAQTYQFIDEFRDYWSTGGVGTFLLTSNALIAKTPEKYGLTILETKAADLPRAVAYRMNGEAESRAVLAEVADRSFNATEGVFPDVLGRPWAGGTDSLHSMIYYNAFGSGFFKANPKLPETAAGTPDGFVRVTAKLVESSFDIAAITANRQKFLRYLRQRAAVPAEPTYESFLALCGSIAPVPAAPDPTYWLVLGKTCVKVSKIVYDLLAAARESDRTLHDLLRGVPDAVQPQLLEFLRRLAGKGLLRFEETAAGVFSQAAAAV